MSLGEMGQGCDKMKRCTKCGEVKDISQFNKHKRAKDRHTWYCKICVNEISTKYKREVLGHLPMSENKECSCYLGMVVAERLFGHLFKDVVRMPWNNSGYDFICNRDKKIDVKSACITHSRKKYPCWQFHINKNKIADYFLLLAFDNRDDLEPQYQWLIPGRVLNHIKSHTTISPSTIDKWDEYR